MKRKNTKLQRVLTCISMDYIVEMFVAHMNRKTTAHSFGLHLLHTSHVVLRHTYETSCFGTVYAFVRLTCIDICEGLIF